MYREAHSRKKHGQTDNLHEGFWESVGNRDFVDGLIFFYVTDTAKDNAIKLQADYDNPLNDDTKKFKANHPKLADFFTAQVNYFTKYSGHFVAFAHCLEVYYAASRLNNKNSNRYYSRFDLNHFYELAYPIKRDLFESSLNDYGISGLSTRFLKNLIFSLHNMHNIYLT